MDSLLFYLLIFFLSNLSWGLVRNGTVLMWIRCCFIYSFLSVKSELWTCKKLRQCCYGFIVVLYIHFLSIKSKLWASKKLGQHCCGFAVVSLTNFLSVKSKLFLFLFLVRIWDSIAVDSLFYLFINFLSSNLSCGLVRN